MHLSANSACRGPAELGYGWLSSCAEIVLEACFRFGYLTVTELLMIFNGLEIDLPGLMASRACGELLALVRFVRGLSSGYHDAGISGTPWF